MQATEEEMSGLTALEARLSPEKPVERHPPGWLAFMPPFIKDLWQKGVNFEMDSQKGEFLIKGFYKNGDLRLAVRQEQFIAIDRREKETVIRKFEDLVELNYQWWVASNTKTQYMAPAEPWLDAFLSSKRAKRKVIYVPLHDEGEESA